MLDSCVCNLCSTYLCALSIEVSSSISWRVVSSTSIMSLTCFMAWMTVAWLRLPMLAPTWTCYLPAGSAWIAARGNQRHRAWAEFHPYGEVGGQGIPSYHTAATACGWQSGLVGGRIHVSLHSDQRLYINQPRGCGVL